MERKIQCVENKEEKCLTYQELLKKYKKGIKEEFYLESLMIIYALIEDRLKSFLFHIGALKDDQELKLKVSKTRTVLRIAYFGSADKANNQKLILNNISTKKELISRVLNYRQNSNLDINHPYLQLLEKELIVKIDLKDLNTLFEQLDAWCKKRNEVVHALGNKNLNHINTYLKELDEEGYNLFRKIDRYISKLRKDPIRIALRLEKTRNKKPV